jgi:toxin-antitoxin system PIN domain toxin
MHLPDINVWLALAFPAHLHHNPARAWFAGLPANRPCHFCRYTQLGFLRIANNPKVFLQAAAPQDQAWQLYDDFLLNSRVGFASESAMLESTWRQFTQGQRFAPKLWNDAYLAAFAQTGGYEVVTFDQGFAQFPGVAVTLLP